jgi:hypothetical protein
VAWFIARPTDYTVVSTRKKPSIHIVKEIRAVIIIVLNNRNRRNHLLARGISLHIGINGIRRANILRNILHRTAAE